MNPSASDIADNASFHAFMNCYLREIDSGVWHAAEDWQRQTGLYFADLEDHVLELQLGNMTITLAIGVNFRSSVGRHRFTTVYQRQENQWGWQALDTVSAILLLINQIYSAAKTLKPSDQADPIPQKIHQQRLELIARTIESHQVMRDYVDKRLSDSRLVNDSFIHSEQSILFGHWLHPTPKSRQGMHSWQHQNYTPELCSSFQLHFFAVDRNLISQNSILEDSAEKIIHDIALKNSSSHSLSQLSESLGETKSLLPVHPLQAQWLIHQTYVKKLIQNNQLLDIGLLGPYFTPTSSVRTLYCEDLDYMIKLSIPVKITNSLRMNMQHELDAGVLVAKLLNKSHFAVKFPQFKIIEDPAFITITLPNRKETGFELIIRNNPFSNCDNARENKLANNVQSIAAIVQDPIDPAGKSRLSTMIHSLVEKEQKSLSELSLFWFEKYWECAIEPAIYLYDQEGIALEAHQQNSLLDISQGYPHNYYYRDNQGFYLSECFRENILLLEPNLASISGLFYSDSMICDRFSYYLIVNQLFSIINRFALDNLIDEMTLLNFVHHRLSLLLTQMTSVGVPLVESIINRKNIPCKGNLLTRIEDLDELQVENELAVYTDFANPLYQLVQKNTPTLSEEAYLESA